MTHHNTPPSLALLLLALLLPACVEEPIHEEIDPAVFRDLVTVEQGVSIAQVSGCSTSAVRGLDIQIIEEMNCLVPDALVDFSDLNVEAAGSAVWTYLQPPAKEALRRALASRGSQMRVNSVYRTIAQQYLLYRWYQEGRCNIGLAAQPGRSNHQSGLALDMSDYNGWRSHLEGQGWSWLGSRDPVHFDYLGGGTRDIRGTAVLAFQRLWNRNNPGDRIDEDGVYGPQTEARLRQSPAEGFGAGASCDDPDPPTPEELHVALSGSLRSLDGQARDLVPDGDSAGVFDLLEGQRVEADVILRNGSARDATDEILIGFELTRPDDLALVDYTIWTDHPALDGETWQVNDANDNPDNPDHANPGASGLMNLYRFSPGESKRVTLVLEARAHIAPEHARVRVWVKHIGGYYGEMDGWDDPVEVNQAGELLRWRAVIDVFDPARIGGGEDAGGMDAGGGVDTGGAADTGGGAMDSGGGATDSGGAADTGGGSTTGGLDSGAVRPDVPSRDDVAASDAGDKEQVTQQVSSDEGCATSPGRRGHAWWAALVMAGLVMWRRR